MSLSTPHTRHLAAKAIATACRDTARAGAVHFANIDLLREHLRHMTDPEAIERAHRTIEHLDALATAQQMAARAAAHRRAA